jgi:hypothetical protein
LTYSELRSSSIGTVLELLQQATTTDGRAFQHLQYGIERQVVLIVTLVEWAGCRLTAALAVRHESAARWARMPS